MGLLFQSQNGAVAVPQNLDEEYPVLFHLLSGDKAHSHSEITQHIPAVRLKITLSAREAKAAPRWGVEKKATPFVFSTI